MRLCVLNNHVCVCVCVCVTGRERERERRDDGGSSKYMDWSRKQGQIRNRERERERERESAWVTDQPTNIRVSLTQRLPGPGKPLAGMPCFGCSGFDPWWRLA